MMKKLMTLLVAVMMVFTMTNRVHAETGDPETATVTVVLPSEMDGENTTNETYTAYLILNATETAELYNQSPIAEGDEGITYYTTAAKAAVLGTYFTFADGNVGGSAVKVLTAHSLTSGGDQEQAQALLAIAKANSFTSTSLTANTAGTEFSATLPLGFYVIESSLGSYVVALTTDMKVAQKNVYPSFTKEFTNTNDKYVAIGDTVEYTIKVTVPETVNKVITITDTLDAGLTYNNDASGASATVNGHVITFTIPASAAGSDVTITYSAHVEETVTYTGAYKNTAHLKYSNYQTKDVELTSKTNKIELLKYDGADTNKKPLPGAVFELRLNGTALTLVGSGASYRLADAEETGVTQFTTVDSGNIVIDGLDSDVSYQFVEISAPEGYNALTADAVPASAPATTNDTVVEVANNTGTVLPSTGGIGTTIFHVAGALLVLGAGIVLISKKRANNN